MNPCTIWNRGALDRLVEIGLFNKAVYDKRQEEQRLDVISRDVLSRKEWWTNALLVHDKCLFRGIEKHKRFTLKDSGDHMALEFQGSSGVASFLEENPEFVVFHVWSNDGRSILLKGSHSEQS